MNVMLGASKKLNVIEIVPAVIPRDLEDLYVHLANVLGAARTVQIDVMDGVFVPEKSWPYTPGGSEEFARVVSGEFSLPFAQDFNFEVDLMVSDPVSAAKHWVRAGAQRVIVHVESVRDVVSALKGIRVVSTDIEVGIAIGIETPNEQIESVIGVVNVVQCMGIARIGYQGEAFDERVVGKVADIHERHPGVTMSVDGGVSAENIARLARSGARRFAVGSAIFNTDDPAEAYRAIARAASH